MRLYSGACRALAGSTSVPPAGGAAQCLLRLAARSWPGHPAGGTGLAAAHESIVPGFWDSLGSRTLAYKLREEGFRSAVTGRAG